MKTMNRRALLGALALGSAGLLAACQTTTTASVTTVSLDIATITRDGQSVLAIAAAFLAEPAIQAMLGANLPTAQTALASANAAMVEVASAVGSQASVSIDTSSVQAAVKSIVQDATQILGYVQVGVDLLPGSLQARTATLITAVETLLPLVSVAAALPGLTGAHLRSTGMTEAAAVHAAKVGLHG